ncbi:MAG: HAD family phosphatase [Firmicutes bacterium]|nr:HAD family phosphatase [Bacillota bacterium]
MSPADDYRLVAIDLDDTLLGDDLKISGRAKQAIRRSREKGIHVTLATGRMLRSVLPYAEELDLNLPLITYQGALVKNSRTGEVLYHRPVPGEFVGPVADIIRSYGYHLQMYNYDELCMERFTPEGADYARLAGVGVTLVEDLRFACPQPTKVLVVNYQEWRLDELARVLGDRFGDSLYVTKSKPHYLEILHPEATKGKALKVVADYFGVPRESVVAIGDSFNDLDMIQYAGLGVVMGNAREEIKRYADYVTRGNNDDGVAEVLEQWVLKEF